MFSRVFGRSPFLSLFCAEQEFFDCFVTLSNDAYSTSTQGVSDSEMFLINQTPISCGRLKRVCAVYGMVNVYISSATMPFLNQEEE